MANVPDDESQREMQVVTASIPLDFQRHWLGVLAMDFSVPGDENVSGQCDKNGRGRRVPAFMIIDSI